jgi:bacterioferritin-associated ferredoxin
MIVCLCAGVPRNAIVELIARGARCPEDVAAACGAGADCGACLDSLADLLSDARPGALVGVAAP